MGKKGLVKKAEFVSHVELNSDVTLRYKTSAYGEYRYASGNKISPDNE